MKILQKIMSVVCAVAVTTTMTSPISIGDNSAKADEVQRFSETNETADLPTALSDEEKPMSGKCGDNVTWYLDSTGTLTIGGTGEMYDFSVRSLYTYDTRPWSDYVSDYAIDHAIDIKNVLIKTGVTNIGEYAFSGCQNLKSVTIPDGVTIISHCSFRGCQSLTSVTIPDGVTSIGGFAFNGCSNLKSVAIPDSVTSIGCEAFAGCQNLKSVTIPDSVTSIVQGAFRWSGLTSVTIPDSVISIGDHAFENCPLTSVTIPDSVTSINEGTFSGCSLTSVTIPDSVTSIGNEAFEYSGLKSITIPDSVTSIGDRAFENCSNLTSVTIPDSVTSIGYSAFGWCSSLEDVYYSGTEEQWKKIKIGGNDYLNSATIHYNSISIGELAGEKVYFNGHTYQVFKFDNVTGGDVISYCKEMSGYMAHINDAEENDFLSNYIRESNIGYAYFGYTDEEVEGDWKWVDGKNSSYTNWGKNEPNNSHGEEHYAIINQDGSWNDGGFEGDSAKGRAFVICEWEGEESTEQTVGNVHFLSSYDPETGKVRFDDSTTHIGLDYTLSDTIDKELAVSSVGKYVVAEIDSDSFTVTDLNPVDSKIGTISAIDKTASTITIDGEVYPLSRDNSVLTMFVDQQIGKTVLFHTYNNIIVAMNSVEEKTGKLESWDYTVQEITIDGKVYPTNSLTDISFLANIDELLGESVLFSYVNAAVYIPIIELCAIPDDLPELNTYITVPFKEKDVTLYWADDLFDRSSYEYNNDLAIASLALCGTAANGDKTSDDIVNTLKKMGFENIEPSNNFSGDNFTEPAYAIASKKIVVGGAKKDLISVTVRGTTTGTDIINDVFDGVMGFEASRAYVTTGLFNYLNKHFSTPDPENMILWISGHSLGGGVASSMSTLINDTGYFQSDNIFTYSFATPNYIPNTKKLYKNIFETINDLDVVPTLGGPGSGRFGITREFDPFEANEYEKYYEEYTKIDALIKSPDPITSFTHYHICLAYMAFLKSGGEPTHLSRQNTPYVVSVWCPVDVEIYDSEGNLLSKVTNNVCDKNVTSNSVLCNVVDDKKFFIISSDIEARVKLIGTDDGTMEYSLQKLKSATEKITDDDFITYENVVLEKGKEFKSDITETDTNPNVSLYVIDPITKQPIITVELDGTEVPISSENTYKITFNANGGTTSSSELITDINGKLSKLPTATRTGYTFDGWFTAAENGEKITADTVFTEDTTVYAHWTMNTETPSVPTTSDSSDTDDDPDVSNSGYSSDLDGFVDSETSTDSEDKSDMFSNVTSDVTPDTSTSSANSGSNDSDNSNPSTGVTVAIIPILLAAGASVVIFRKKNSK